MLNVIETSIETQDMEGSHLDGYTRVLKVERKFICLNKPENHERIDRIVKKLLKRYDTSKVLEKRPWSNIHTRDMFSTWIWSGKIAHQCTRLTTIIETFEEEMVIRKRRLNGLKGALTRNINKAKKVRESHKSTLFPEHYKSDPKFLNLIGRIKLNKEKYKKELREYQLFMHSGEL